MKGAIGTMITEDSHPQPVFKPLPMRLLLATFTAILAFSSPHLADCATLEDDFRDPPPWTGPWRYLVWVAGDATGDGITKPNHNHEHVETQ